MNRAKVILSGIVGSRAYGTATEDSDTDLMSVVIPPIETYLGIDYWGNQGTAEQRTEDGGEHTFYELRKFVKLCINFNPNVIPLLWLPEHCYRDITPAGQKLIDNRNLFNSKQAYYSLTGYAQNQCKKMVARGSETTGKMGARRKDLVKKYGYDTKFAMHTIRLLRMCAEFLTRPEEGLRVHRNDYEELLRIRAGAVSMEAVLDRAQSLLDFSKFRLNGSELPEKPDNQKINELLLEIFEQDFGIRTKHPAPAP